MAEWTRKVSRRKFLQSSAAAGVALSLPWLPGCGDDDGTAGSQSPTPGPLEGRRQHTLHFDLSGVSGAGTFVLHAIGSKANKLHLTAHTAATRAEFRASTAPQGISDAQLTHFAKGVDLPAGAVQHIWVTAGTEPSDPLVLSKLFCGIDPNNPQTWISPRDTAIALIFHHNEIVRLDPDQAAMVCAHIEDSPVLDQLATILRQKGAFVAVPATDFDGNPVLGANGKQLVQHDPSDTVLAVANAVVRDVLERVFDDPELEDANWHAASGFTVPVAETTNLLSAQEDELFEADYPADPHARKWVHGVYFTSLKLEDPATRTIEIHVKNYWLRWLTAHVDFLTPDGFAVQSEEVPLLQGIMEYDLSGIRAEGGVEPVKARFLAALGANSDILGIPVQPAQIPETFLRFRMPPEASVARVMFLTLGLGGWDLPGEDNVEARKVPLYLTGIFNIGLPAVFLGLAIGTNPLTVVSLTKIASDPFLWADLARLIPSSILKSIRLNDKKPFFLAFGSKLVSLFFKVLPALAAKISAIIAMEEVEEAVPVVGWGVKLASIGAATSELLQTVGEVFSGPSYFENKISVTLTTRLIIKHDPNDPAGFPATATMWEAYASYGGKLGRGYRGTLPPSRTDPIRWEYGGVPSGGKGKMEVLLLSDNNFLAGYGTLEFINVPGAGNVLTLEVTITENLVPLTANTRYHHNRKLAITNGHYTWQAAKDAPPTQTVADLVCDQDGLCDLNGITVNETAAVVGYSWQAPSPTVPLCTGGTSTTPVHRIQNVSFTPRAEDRLQQALCGYTGKPLLAYELRSAPGQGGRSFYLDPSDEGYHLRAVNLDASTFDQASRMSWGQFSQQQNALAIHPAGYVVGINTQYHKLEILQLREGAAPDAEVASSVLKAGKGTRVGLLDTPYAVAVDLRSGAIYVLEGGNSRIQAFDVHGTPMARFARGTKAVRLLHPEADVTYLDMAVESTGLIYVLSFVGGGRHPADYRLDIYDLNDGDQYLSRTTGVAAGKMAVDLWRNIFTLNYEPIVGPNGVEPSISEWIPST